MEKSTSTVIKGGDTKKPVKKKTIDFTIRFDTVKLI
jgi:hypothetical protein